MRGILRYVRAVAIGGVVGSALGGILAAERALHIEYRPQPEDAVANVLAERTHSTWEAVEVAAADGAVLRAWFFEPAEGNGAVVLVLHGVSDSRAGMLDHAQFLLRSGYAVLLADLRGHGQSGGAITTYGIREAADVTRWVDWLAGTRHIDRLYGVGMSLGGAQLLQSLAGESRFRAVVAEAPYASFREIAYDRMSEATGLERHFFVPVIEAGFLYARFRYGLDLRQASPIDAVRGKHTPILLIHGTADERTPIRHSRELQAINPGAVRLWEVSGARHGGALSARPREYEQAVLDWFQAHP